MEAINRDIGYDAHLECPKCREAGLVTESGYVAGLMYFPALDPPFHCTGVHGAITASELAAFGVDPSAPSDVLPAHEAGLHADPRHP